MPSDSHQLVDHLFRHQAGQMVAWLTRIFGPAHLELAEEVVQDALLKALQQWPFSGIPENPAGWLFAVARNRALDVLRRNTSFHDRAAAIAIELNSHNTLFSDIPEAVKDDELRMVFMCCHPELPRDGQVALSLKTVGGFSTAEIARAFLTSESTIAQRIVRAKRTLRDGQIPFELPHASALSARLEPVLEVIYLMFNEGYAAHTGETLVRQDLCREAIRLGRLVAGSPLAGRPSAHALVALMALHAARIPARISESGEMVLLEDQDRSLWDARLLALGFAHLERSISGRDRTAYHVQAAIATIHAAAPSYERTDWPAMLALYDDLLALSPSPIVELNRAVVLARVKGTDAALQAIARLEGEPALADYYLLPSVKGALLNEIGDAAGAALAFGEALKRRCSEPEKRFLLRRLRAAAKQIETMPSGRL
jgi:RNA polymerase sigma-70 factor (ECF subfamily)